MVGVVGGEIGGSRRWLDGDIRWPRRPASGTDIRLLLVEVPLESGLGLG